MSWSCDRCLPYLVFTLNYDYNPMFIILILIGIGIISKQVLKEQQVITLGDALKNVSGVTTSNPRTVQDGRGGASQNIFLRGFSSETFFRNGFRLQQGAASREMANVESVEVLKGPAAILYGLVEPGGMVNVVTKQPLTTPYYALNQQFGSYDLYRTTLDASGPIANNKDVLYRMNMSYQNSGSFRDFVGTEDVFFAPVLKWNISPKTQATFELEYNHAHSGLDFGFVPTSPDGKTLLRIPINRNFGAYSPSTTETIFGGINWSHQFNDDWAIKHRFSVNQMGTSIPSLIVPTGVFDDGSLADQAFGLGIGGLPAPSGKLVQRQQNEVRSQYNTYSTNLDLVGHFDTGFLKHTLLVGGDYYRMNSNTTFKYPSTPFQVSWVSLNNPVNPGSPEGDFGGAASNNTSQNQTDQYGLYAQDQIKLPYGIHITGGLRYQYLHQSNSSINPNSPASNTATAQSQDAVTPRVGILWQPKDWISLYANYVESFGANDPGALVFPGKPIAPTSATQYEGGIKTQFFDGRLRATLAYYDLTKTNVPSTDPNPTHICGGSRCAIALGEVRSRGPELDIQGEILPGWNAIATWSNTDIIVTKTNGTNDPTSGDSSGGAGGALGLKPGDRVQNVPRNTASFWTTYEVQESELKGLKFGGGVTVRDGQSTFGGFDNNFNLLPSQKLPGYTTVGLMAAYSRDIGKAKVTVQFNVDNLLDEKYFTTAVRTQIDPTVGSNGAGVSFGTPRTFMGQVSVQY
ncbi:ferrichrome-iron receptor [Methyloglobulus morosus KoM1]|uniref:Ferrichrome-iron receptor n=1 Tax=Methyloglobulus morosus KoM1 TaxID=1116472 RepID=V5DXQ8_9GAMM|nr:ferrichrome-iron receptor [Methyloglobulus morosus KoM1]